MVDIKFLIFGNALWYEIVGVEVKLIVAKSVYKLEPGLSHIKETALF